MPRQRKALTTAAKTARAAALQARSDRNSTVHQLLRSPDPHFDSPAPSLSPPVIEISSSESECGYMGGVNVDINTDSESDGEVQLVMLAGCESLSEFDESDVGEMRENAVVGVDEEQDLCSVLEMGLDKKGWKKVEANRSLGYNGLSSRTKRRKNAKARQAHDEREKAKTS
jgi:hypothetical protein